MKIQGGKPTERQSKVKVQKTGAAAKPAGKTVSGPAAAASGADKVDVSSGSGEITELKGAIAGMPEMRAEKVQAIEKTVTDGTYKVDSEKVAEKMIDEMT